MRFHELLASQPDAIVRRWASEIEVTVTPERLPRTELADHMPAFVKELACALQQEECREGSPNAAKHGEQRLRLGFDLGAVVREYGVLYRTILDIARENDVPVAKSELCVLFESLIMGIADATSEYTRQRDAEQQRQATEHFAFIAHELRNPLHSARLAFKLLEDGGRGRASGRAAEALDRGLTHMHDLIEHSLELAHEASGISLNRTKVRLAELLGEVEGLVRIDADAKGVRLRVHHQFDAADEAAIDVRLVRSALSNLARNAIKFTEGGGVVELRGKVANGRLVVEVEDSCGGLEPGMVEKAFTPFVQKDSTKDGFGLGLAIARQAANAHGGTVRVQNLPGKGCIFALELPVV